jgi:hypothetical protein
MSVKATAFMQKIKPIMVLNKKLNSFKYGIQSADKKQLDTGVLNEKKFNENYTLMSTAEFKKLGGGTCWDYTRIYEETLHKLGFETISLFIFYGVNGKDFNTHTISIAIVDGVYVWVESAWKPQVGVYIASDFDELIKAIGRKLVDGAQNYSKTYHIQIRDFYESPPAGISCQEAMEYYTTAKLIYEEDYRGKRGNYFFKELSNGLKVLNTNNPDIFTEEAEGNDEIFMEATIPHSFIMKGILEKKIFDTLDNPENRKVYSKIQSDYINKNADKLATAGPQYLIVFGDGDHQYYYDLFGLNKEEVTAGIKEVVKSSGAGSDFKFLTNNPILCVLYYCIRYFTVKNDQKAVNSTLGIYALAIYWSIFTKYFPKGVIEPVMAYTIDNMTDRFAIKKCGTIFNTLCQSINQSYTFHRKRFFIGGDDDICAFAQRIRNDQNSMIKKIANQYTINYKSGKAVTTRNDNYDADNPIIDDIENSTTKIAILTSSIVPQMISNGVDLRLATAAAKMANISVTDCREYLTQLISNEHMHELESLVQSTLYVFLVNDQRESKEIKSQYFLTWGYALFKKTNSKDPNIVNINNILKKWIEVSGIYERYSEYVRIRYEKGLFLYIILTIQKYA